METLKKRSTAVSQRLCEAATRRGSFFTVTFYPSPSLQGHNNERSILMPMATSHTIKGRGHSMISITFYTLLTLSVGMSFQVALPAPSVHSFGEALPRFRGGNSGANALVMTDHQQEQTNTNPPPGTGGINAPPKTPNQTPEHRRTEMNDGQEASVTPDRENLDLDGDQAGPETGNSGCRVFMGLGDDQSRQTQEMRHWIRSVEDRLVQKHSRKRGRSRSRSGT
ncbi:hypothetical protein PIB30_060566 [Stylosanthes scabra]|uniref:Transmembrane protein n=1 Tax=Stylosanthes scabra TaxID=79078 RepID=A0ABU6WNC1_9FABA|nr:hypothetical protein [Stylosanthes scabra]